MKTDYDEIAQEYKSSKEMLWRHYIEQYTLLELIGDISGKAVLDLACGDGHYTRLLKDLGPSRVVGVDISTKMIELAEESERADPLGVEYRIGDALKLRLRERFDVIVAAYLLNYARNAGELLCMCESVSRHLKPGGRFVAVNNNPEQDVSDFHATRKYGFVKDAQGEIRNGTPIRYTFFLDGGAFEIENFHLDSATHEWALRRAGLADIQWHAPKLSPDQADEPSQEYWQDFLRDPPITLIQARKSKV